MTAIAVGNLPVEELIGIVEDGFNRYGRDFDTPLPPDINLVGEKPFEQIIRQEYIDPNLQQARLVMLWRVPGCKDLAQTYGLDILAAILSHGRMSRLVGELRERDQLVNQISVSNMTFLAQGVFYISAQLPTENIPQVERRIIEILRSLHDELLTEAEIARVSRQAANRFIFTNETPSDRSNLYGYYHTLFQDISMGMEYPAIIKSISAEDVQTAAKAYLNPQGYGVLVVKPN
jgi:predicted Zn-dependent peptidase